IQKQINTLGTNLIMITPGSSVQGGVSQGAGTMNRITVEDAEKLKRESTLLSAVSPVVMTRLQVVGGTGNWRTGINGVAAEVPTIRDWTVASGSFFTDADVRSSRKVAVIGNTIAKNLFTDADPVGQQLRIRNEPFTIIGVLSIKGQNAN